MVRRGEMRVGPRASCGVGLFFPGYSGWGEGFTQGSGQLLTEATWQAVGRGAGRWTEPVPPPVNRRSLSEGEGAARGLP